jgi:thymidylate kinase
MLVQAGPTPDLTLVLDATGAVLFARKGEHDATHLEDAARRYRSLAERLDAAVVLDASQPAEDVRRAAVDAIWRAQIAGRR